MVAIILVILLVVVILVVEFCIKKAVNKGADAIHNARNEKKQRENPPQAESLADRYKNI